MPNFPDSPYLDDLMMQFAGRWDPENERSMILPRQEMPGPPQEAAMAEPEKKRRSKLAALLQAIGAIPGKLNEAQYEHTTPVRETTASIPFPDGGNATIPTGTEPGTPQRTGRLSGFGDFVKNGLPEIARGAVVAAGSPTPGQVGTAGDILGALKAVGQDRQGRMDRARDQQQQDYAMGRQMQQDADKQRVQEAQIKGLEATANARNRVPVAKDPIAVGKARLAEMKARGIEPSEMDIRRALGLAGAQQQNKSMQAILAQAPDDYYRGPDAARLQEQFPTIKDYIADVQERGAAYEEATAAGRTKGKFANTPIVAKGLATKEGIRNYFPARMNPTTGAVTGGTVSEPIAQPPAPKPTQPRAPRYQIVPNASGGRDRINIDTGESSPVPGSTRPPTGAENAAAQKRKDEEVAGQRRQKLEAARQAYNSSADLKRKYKTLVDYLRAVAEGKEGGPAPAAPSGFSPNNPFANKKK